MSTIAEFDIAYLNYKRSAEAVAAATKAALSEGTIVRLEMGRATVCGPIVSAGGSWWHEPDRFSVMNTKTGKVRYSTLRYALECCNLQIVKEVAP